MLQKMSMIQQLNIQVIEVSPGLPLEGWRHDDQDYLVLVFLPPFYNQVIQSILDPASQSVYNHR